LLFNRPDRRRRRFHRLFLQIFVKQSAARTLTHAIDRHMTCDKHQPRNHLAPLRTIRGSLSPELNESILNRLARILRIFEDTPYDAVHDRAKFQIQKLQRLSITRSQASDKLAVYCERFSIELYHSAGLVRGLMDSVQSFREKNFTDSNGLQQ